MAVKWGVIGAGGIASRRTIPEGITKASNGQLVAVMDCDEARAKKAAEQFGNVPWYTKEADLLANRDVQAVYIATPTKMHCEQTVLAAKAGKHVLCEKAMAMTVREAKQMISACKKAKVKLGIGYMMRFHAYHRRIKEMIEAGQLGQIVLGRAQLSCWYPPIEGAWRQAPELGGGGSLMDMGSHCIDLIEFLAGSQVAEVSCFASTLTHSYKAEDTATVLFKLANGAHGIVDNHFNIPDAASKNILEIYGTRGSVLCRGTVGQAPGGEATAYLEREAKGYDAKQQRTDQSVVEEIKPEPVNMYRAEVEAFSEAIERNAEPPIGGEHGLWNLKVCLACYESARKGKAVRMKG